MTTKKMDEIMPDLLEKASQRKPETSLQPLIEESCNAIGAARQITPQELKQIASQLYLCHVSQKNYGQKAEDIPLKAKAILMDLSDFSANDIEKAIVQCRRENSTNVTTADILDVLNPQPKWQASVFQELTEKRKRGDMLTFTEEKYIKGYKKHAMKGLC